MRKPYSCSWSPLKRFSRSPRPPLRGLGGGGPRAAGGEGGEAGGGGAGRGGKGPHRARHVLVDDREDPLGGLLHRLQAHRVRDLLHGSAGRVDVELHLAAEEKW